MNTEDLEKIVIKLAELNKQKFDRHDLKEKYSEKREYNDLSQFGQFITDITDMAQRIGLILISNKQDHSTLRNFIKDVDYPILVFKNNVKIEPYLVFHDDKDKLKCLNYSSEIPVEESNPLELLPELYAGPDSDNPEDVYFLTIYPLYTLVSDINDAKNREENDKQFTPVQRLFRLLKTEKKDITYIYIYAIGVGIINLSLPLGIQAIIGMVSGGLVFSSVVVLISLVILGVLISGGLQVMQITLVEILQRRVFTKATYEFAYRIPRINSETLLKYYPPELMNRFFDITTVQKGLPKVLIEVTASVLQIFFGLILLSFYHPFFIAFGLGLVGILFIIFYLTGSKGLQTSLTESKYKYKVAHWLEELARTVISFKLAGQTNLPVQKADNYVNKYLYYRKSHFGVLLTQYINIVVFKTVVIGTLLALGTYLVVDRQITLGQFVASEIVVVIILSNVEKVILSLDVIYDLLTGLEKIANVTDLPLERSSGIKMDFKKSEKGVGIVCKDLHYSYPDAHRSILNGINLQINPGERICIAGFNGSGKDTFIKVLSGVLESYKGIVTINGISLRDVHLPSLRDSIDKNVSQEDLFDGTILDNITMGRSHVTYKDVLWAIEKLGLNDTLNALPDGLHTELTAGGKKLSGSVINKLTLARSVVSKPKLLIVNDYLQFIEKKEKLKIASFLHDIENHWTLLSISNDPVMLAAADRVIVLQAGKVAAEGSFEELRNNSLFQDILYK